MSMGSGSLADVLKRLGNVPLERIRMHERFGMATEKDLVEYVERTDRICELVDGVIVEKASGFYESRLGVVLIGRLEAFGEESDLGFSFGRRGVTSH